MKPAFSALMNAASGIDANLRGLERTAQTIASASLPRDEPIELAEALIVAIVQSRALEASANALRRVDEAIGSIVDALA